MPTLDSALLLAARELGLFRAHGLDVRLQREVGWATVREKLLHDELDAALGHAGLLFSIYFGLDGVRRPCLTGLLFGHQGTAITISAAAWHLGIRDPASLAARLRLGGGPRRFKAGVPLAGSAAHLILDRWVRQAGLQLGVDLDVAFLPANLMPAFLHTGHLDIMCTPEPWNSLAALAGDGVVAASGSALGVDHPDSALIVMQDLAEARAEEHERLLAALLEAAKFCAAPDNREELARLLAGHSCLDVPIAVLRNFLSGPFRCGAGIQPATASSTLHFNPASVLPPTRANARRIYDTVHTLAAEPIRQLLRPEPIRRIFREDIFAAAERRARTSLSSTPPASLDTHSRDRRSKPSAPGRPPSAHFTFLNLDPTRTAAPCPAGATV